MCHCNGKTNAISANCIKDKNQNQTSNNCEKLLLHWFQVQVITMSLYACVGVCVSVFYARTLRFCSLISVINLALPGNVKAIRENCICHIISAAKSKEPKFGTTRKQRKCSKKRLNSYKKKKRRK